MQLESLKENLKNHQQIVVCLPMHVDLLILILGCILMRLLCTDVMRTIAVVLEHKGTTGKEPSYRPGRRKEGRVERQEIQGRRLQKGTGIRKFSYYTTLSFIEI